MSETKTAGQVFNEWASDERASKMSAHHWPLVKQAFDLIPPQKGRYLEIGVGNGYAICQMATHQFSKGSCLGIDVSGGMVNLARTNTAGLKNVEIKQADFLSPDFSEQHRFDVIFSMEVFYYFKDIQQGIAKTFSLLHPGGQLFILVDYYLENTINQSWPRDLNTEMTLWAKNDYLDAFESAGFKSLEQCTFVDTTNPNRTEADLGTLCTFGTRP